MCLVRQLYYSLVVNDRPSFISISNIFTSCMRIAHTASLMISQFLSFLLSTVGGSGHMHYLANVPGLEHFPAKDPTPTPSRHEHYLANVPGHEHFLAKNPPPPPPAMSTFWLTSARYAIDIRIAFLLPFCFGQKLLLSCFSKDMISVQNKLLCVWKIQLGKVPLATCGVKQPTLQDMYC